MRIGLLGRMVDSLVASHLSLMGMPLLLLLLLLIRLTHRGRVLGRIGSGSSVRVWHGGRRGSTVSAVLVAAGMLLWRRLLDLLLLLLMLRLLVRLLRLVWLMWLLHRLLHWLLHCLHRLLHRGSLLGSHLVWLVWLLLNWRLLTLLLRGILNAILALEGLDGRRCLVGNS